MKPRVPCPPQETLQELNDWAGRYEIMAAFGYLALLLALGRALNNFGKLAKFRFTPPAAVIAGFLGLALTDIAGVFSGLLQVELESAMRSIEVNIVNFAFTALVLGFMSSGKGRITPKATVGSILHEGMPMLLYAQALIWGNSCVALAICGIYRCVTAQPVPPGGAQGTVSLPRPCLVSSYGYRACRLL